MLVCPGTQRTDAGTPHDAAVRRSLATASSRAFTMAALRWEAESPHRTSARANPCPRRRAGRQVGGDLLSGGRGTGRSGAPRGQGGN